MTKKSIILIIFISSILSIMMIAVWGTLPENTNLGPIETIEFTEFDTLNEDSEKVRDVKPFVTTTNPVYRLNYDLGPDESYSELSVTLSLSHINYQLDIYDKIIYIYYGLEDIENEIVLTVTIKDSRTQKSDMIILWFKPPGVIIVPDL